MPHVHELNDFTVTGYIVHAGKIVLVHHKKLGVWIPPGGHVELDEDPIQTLWREMEEETGIKRADLTLVDQQDTIPGIRHIIEYGKNEFQPLALPFAMFIVDYDRTQSNHRHIDMCYLLQSKTDKIAHQLAEAHGIGWFDQAELDKLFAAGLTFENSHAYASYALRALSDK